MLLLLWRSTNSCNHNISLSMHRSKYFDTKRQARRFYSHTIIRDGEVYFWKERDWTSRILFRYDLPNCWAAVLYLHLNAAISLNVMRCNYLDYKVTGSRVSKIRSQLQAEMLPVLQDFVDYCRACFHPRMHNTFIAIMLKYLHALSIEWYQFIEWKT